MSDVNARILFEPWGLGDALIAAAILREEPSQFQLACHPQWHSAIRAALAGTDPLNLLTAELNYTTRDRKSFFDSHSKGAPTPDLTASEILSIRGDFRDILAAKRLFPKAKIHAKGWSGFLARRLKLFDLPYKTGFLTVQNRYRSWCKLTGIPYTRLELTYRKLQRLVPDGSRVAIHIGAQWKSRQYPHVALLGQLLEKKGFEVNYMASPIPPQSKRGDSLPSGLTEKKVMRLQNQDLVNEFKRSSWVITNDSGPMHLAALVGCRTRVISRISNIKEWIPPATQAILSPDAPRGYRPDPAYTSDQIVAGWPEPQQIVGTLGGD